MFWHLLLLASTGKSSGSQPNVPVLNPQVFSTTIVSHSFCTEGRRFIYTLSQSIWFWWLNNWEVADKPDCMSAKTVRVTTTAIKIYPAGIYGLSCVLSLISAHRSDKHRMVTDSSCGIWCDVWSWWPHSAVDGCNVHDLHTCEPQSLRNGTLLPTPLPLPLPSTTSTHSTALPCSPSHPFSHTHPQILLPTFICWGIFLSQWKSEWKHYSSISPIRSNLHRLYLPIFQLQFRLVAVGITTQLNFKLLTSHHHGHMPPTNHRSLHAIKPLNSYANSGCLTDSNQNIML